VQNGQEWEKEFPRQLQGQISPEAYFSFSKANRHQGGDSTQLKRDLLRII
jgi:hypothetical protein